MFLFLFCKMDGLDIQSGNRHHLCKDGRNYGMYRSNLKLLLINKPLSYLTAIQASTGVYMRNKNSHIVDRFLTRSCET